MKKTTMGELDRTQRAKEVQMQGGTDLDTTNLDKPAGLERTSDDLIRDEDREYGPLSTAVSGDPTAEDPFVPGTEEAPENFDAEALESAQERHLREKAKKLDPQGEKGPTYEVHQGTNPRPDGGSTDPNSDLTHDSSGLQD